MESMIPRLWIVASVFLLAQTPLRAADCIWTNALGGNWNDAANWSCLMVPGSGDNALITLPGIYAVTQDVNVAVASLTLGAATGKQTLTNDSHTLTLLNASTVN